MENLTDEEVAAGATNRSFAATDLLKSIEKGEYPSCTLCIQTMDPANEDDLDYARSDDTKVWPEEDFLLKEVVWMPWNRAPVIVSAENKSQKQSASEAVDSSRLIADRAFCVAFWIATLAGALTPPIPWKFALFKQLHYSTALACTSY